MGKCDPRSSNGIHTPSPKMRDGQERGRGGCMKFFLDRSRQAKLPSDNSSACHYLLGTLCIGAGPI